MSQENQDKKKLPDIELTEISKPLTEEELKDVSGGRRRAAPPPPPNTSPPRMKYDRSHP